MGTDPFTVVVADDEPGVRLRIRGLLEQVPGVEVVGEASDGPRAIALMRERCPHLALLDSQLPRLNAVEVLLELGSRTLPAVLFMAAGGGREPEALFRRASDWIPKPVSRDRLQQAVERVRGQLKNRVSRGTPLLPADGRIAVKSGSRILMLDANSIVHIAATNNHCRIMTSNRTLPVRENLSALTARLPPEHFLRVNRSAVIHVGAVRALESKSHGDWLVRLKDGQEFVVSRTRRVEVLRRLRVLI